MFSKQSGMFVHLLECGWMDGWMDIVLEWSGSTIRSRDPRSEGWRCVAPPFLFGVFRLAIRECYPWLDRLSCFQDVTLLPWLSDSDITDKLGITCYGPRMAIKRALAALAPTCPEAEERLGRRRRPSQPM